MQTIEERNFYVVQMQGPYRNEIGKMTEMTLYAHVRTRLGNDMAAAEAVIRELEEKGTATVHFTNSLGPETMVEIQRLLPTETYGRGTHVPCYACGRRIFPDGPVAVEIRAEERWVKLECASPSCAAYKQPHWYPEEALEIHGTIATSHRKFADGARVRGREEGTASFRGRTGTVTSYLPNSGYWVCFDDGHIENVPSHWLEAA
jgi:hypothetical protein